MVLSRYRYCKSRMVAFINGELPPKARRRVARYIDECPDCYAEYIHQRDLQRELKSRVPVIGLPEAGQLERIWGAVQIQMQQTASPRRWRYGFITAVVVIMLMMPLLFTQPAVDASVATQPQPEQYVLDTRTPGPTPVAVVANSTIELTGEIVNVTPAAAVTPGR